MSYLTNLKAYIALFYALCFGVSFAFLTMHILPSAWKVPKDSWNWYFVMLLLTVAWAGFITRVRPACGSYEKWLIAKICNQMESLNSPSLPTKNVFVNILPLALFGGGWYLNWQYGKGYGEVTLHLITLIAILAIAIKEKNYVGVLPGFILYIATYFLKQEWNMPMQYLGDTPLFSLLRYGAIILAVMGLRFRERNFWRIFLIFWGGLTLLIVALGYAAKIKDINMYDKPLDPNSMQYLAVFLILGLVFCFPVGLRAAYIGTTKIGIAEKIVSSGIGAVKILLGLCTMAIVVGSIESPYMIASLLLPVAIVLTVYFGDELFDLHEGLDVA